MQWSVDGAIGEDAAPYDVAFIWTGGANGISIRNVNLVVGDAQVSADAHEGQAGPGNAVNNVWHLKVPAGSTYQPVWIRAELKAEGGTDSYGQIIIYGL
jgi:hypothetical protein